MVVRDMYDKVWSLKYPDIPPGYNLIQTKSLLPTCGGVFLGFSWFFIVCMHTGMETVCIWHGNCLHLGKLYPLLFYLLSNLFDNIMICQFHATEGRMPSHSFFLPVKKEECHLIHSSSL